MHMRQGNWHEQAMLVTGSTWSRSLEWGVETAAREGVGDDEWIVGSSRCSNKLEAPLRQVAECSDALGEGVILARCGKRRTGQYRVAVPLTTEPLVMED